MRASLLRITATFVSLLFAAAASAGLCPQWSQAAVAGELDAEIIPEASGLAVSPLFPNRLYHVNDSGGGPFFHITDLKGSHQKTVRIEGANPHGDFEALSAGPCPSNGACLFVGDIGDNQRSRKHIEVLVIKEEAKYAEPVTPIRRLRLRYPDGPRDAEGLAIHPNGDLFLLTKEFSLRGLRSYPARLYRLPREAWKKQGDDDHTLLFVAEIDLAQLNGNESFLLGELATDFAIAPGGKNFLILTYQNAFEFALDLSASGLPASSALSKGVDYQVIHLDNLPQQEALAYLNGGSVLYNTEFKGGKVEIRRVDCTRD